MFRILVGCFLVAVGAGIARDALEEIGELMEDN